jgi:RNA polymerase sigma-70 factor, ECF subfamily
MSPDELDFQQVYDEFHPRIRRYLGRLVGSGEAEDVTQEVFVKVSRALPEFRRDCTVSTWIYRIATNTAFDRLRSPSFRRAGQVPLQIGKPAMARPPDIEQALVRQEMNECIRRYVDELPPNYRSVILLSEDEGLTNQEIAETLGITLDTVKIRLHRARARLKKQLGSGCDLYRDGRNELACEPRTEGVSPGD